MWTAGMRNLGGFLKEVFVGDQVPALSQGLSCSTTEKQRGKEGNIIQHEIRAVAICTLGNGYLQAHKQNVLQNRSIMFDNYA